jgi:hypothetical protein
MVYDSLGLFQSMGRVRARDWARVAVRGVQVGSFLEKDQREGVGRAAARFLKQCSRFAWILLLLLPSTKGQG